MRLEWLEDMLAIASTGSFSGAAERRRLTQSAFSRRIQQIEQHVGVELFDRSQKPVQLRATTLAQSAQIEQISAAIRQLVTDLRRGDRMASNRIVISSQHSLTTSLAPRIISGLKEYDENVYVRLRSANLEECIGQVLSRQADVAIIYRMLDEPEDMVEGFLETVEVGTDRLIPVSTQEVADRFKGADAPEVLPYIDYPADVFLGRVMASKIMPLLAASVLAIPKAETALTLAALEMAASGVAVAWLPHSVAQPHIANGRVVDLSQRLPSCPLQIKAVRLFSNHGPAETALWSQLRGMGEKSL
ncbi:MAG: LysR family transcriptional regulator [Cypionkella sp.]